MATKAEINAALASTKLPKAFFRELVKLTTGPCEDYGINIFLSKEFGTDLEHFREGDQREIYGLLLKLRDELNPAYNGTHELLDDEYLEKHEDEFCQLYATMVAFLTDLFQEDIAKELAETESVDLADLLLL